METDWFRCRDCGAKHGISFDGQPLPETPMWPVSEERVRLTRTLAVLRGLRELILISDFFEPPLVFPSNKTEWTIGRHPDCDVQILSRSLAKTHAVLSVANNGYLLRDAASGVETTVSEDNPFVLGEVRVRLISRRNDH